MQAWLQQFLDTHGYTAITLLTGLINAFPPLPAESTLPMLAHTMSSTDVTLIPAAVAATGGLALAPNDIERSTRRSGRYGALVVLFGRLIQGMRSLVSIPAGFHRMPFLPCLLYSSATASSTTTMIQRLPDRAVYSSSQWRPLTRQQAHRAEPAAVYILRLWRHHHRTDGS